MLVAVIKDGKIASIATVESEEQVQELASKNEAVVDISDWSPAPQVGWDFDGSKIITPAGYLATRKITKLGLRQRFTFPELIAITTAAATTVPIQVLLSNLQVATYVDLNRADTVGGLNLLVAYGCLTSERAAAILNAEISELEKYRGNE